VAVEDEGHAGQPTHHERRSTCFVVVRVHDVDQSAPDPTPEADEQRQIERHARRMEAGPLGQPGAVRDDVHHVRAFAKPRDQLRDQHLGAAERRIRTGDDMRDAHQGGGSR
jgi:hypothetical protein